MHRQHKPGMHSTKECSSLLYSPVIFMAAAGMCTHTRPKLSSFSPGTLNTRRDQNAKVKGSMKEASCSHSVCLFSSVFSYLPIKSLFDHTEPRKAFKQAKSTVIGTVSNGIWRACKIW